LDEHGAVIRAALAGGPGWPAAEHPPLLQT
jgi:hypothetical protein